MCNSPLELPSVHFLCGHSFHQHCFESYAESEAECPTCTPENRKVMDMLRAQEQKRDLHELFNRQVQPYKHMQQIINISWHIFLILLWRWTSGINRSSCFYLQLRSSNDGFSVVADYFGRGVFNKLTLITDPPGGKAGSGSLEADLQRDLLIHTKRNAWNSR